MSSVFPSRPLLVFVGTFIIWSAGCSDRGKTQNSSSPAPNSADAPLHARGGPITFGPGEATTTPAASGSPDSGAEGAVSALDVAGVKLAMTPEQVIMALKGFDSGLTLSKRYLAATNPYQLTYGSPTSPEECMEKEPLRLFVGLVGVKGTTFLGGLMQSRVMTAGADLAGCGDDNKVQPGDEAELATVYLGPEPGNHRVIAVSLWRSFKTPSTVDAVMDGALKKYPSDLTAKRSQGTDRYSFWRFDARGRVMSEDTAKRQNLLTPWIDAGGSGRALPGQVYEGRGIGLDLVIETDFQNPQLAKQFRVSLYDENALYQFIGEAKALYNAFHEQQLKEETDKAKKSASPVKM